uniref:Mu-theraphotoxin-Pm1a n=1 Tax=Poecilotheria metallica TaxID=1956341 RepID=TX621_POEME|nr:RecName: Full=Mu-theraphotoxin-Pm1a; Short=Mu-TRTX-Pm1a [Poecilotheria metallica]
GGCRYFLGGCSEHSDCCEHLRCKMGLNYCAWDGTF